MMWWDDEFLAGRADDLTRWTILGVTIVAAVAAGLWLTVFGWLSG